MTHVPGVGPDERVLFHERSEHQEILLTQDARGELGLTLDRVWQFHGSEEARFHELLADPPMMMAPRVAEVLVLGGGDGLVVRNVLRYADVRRVVLCELDAAVIEMARQVPELVALSEASLSDPRVEVRVQDAREYLHEADDEFDVIICDFPACTHAGLESLFAPGFFASLLPRLRPGGVMAAQISLEPEGFWPVLAAVESAFASVKPLLARIDGGPSSEESWANAVVAGTEPLSTRRACPQGRLFAAPTALSDHEIHNRGGTGFETVAYAKGPIFQDNWAIRE